MTRYVINIIYVLSITLLPPAYAEQEEPTINVDKLQSSPSFTNFMKKFGKKLEAFQSQNMPSVESVFYPFGGPDLLHPLLLFPDATTFVLVGLEQPGAAVSPENADMTLVKIGSLLKRGFFVTANMGKSFNPKSGVRTALGLQILLMGGEIISDELLDPKTVKIVFQLRDKQRTVYFLRRDLVSNTDSVAQFLDENNIRGACLMKAASYCPHRPMFAELVQEITNRFDYIVQDDTGIPFKHLKGYDVRPFGRYVQPYGKEWRGYEQSKLKNLFDENPETPHVNFCYGYGCGRVEANIIIASRKKETTP